MMLVGIIGGRNVPLDVVAGLDVWHPNRKLFAAGAVIFLFSFIPWKRKKNGGADTGSDDN
jgi:hypothetical protein